MAQRRTKTSLGLFENASKRLQANFIETLWLPTRGSFRARKLLSPFVKFRRRMSRKSTTFTSIPLTLAQFALRSFFSFFLFFFFQIGLNPFKSLPPTMQSLKLSGAAKHRYMIQATMHTMHTCQGRLIKYELKNDDAIDFEWGKAEHSRRLLEEAGWEGHQSGG